jgi:hypothetical protein
MKVGEETRTKMKPCAPLPEFERLSYFYGQMLGVQDFRTEQAYFREKLKLHNRCLHGYGVICGLEVTPVPYPEPCEPESEREWEEICQRLDELDKELSAIEGRLRAYDVGDEEAEQLKKRRSELEAQREDWRRRKQCAPRKKTTRRERPVEVLIRCGLALDCEGNELILREARIVELTTALGASERKCLEEEEEVKVYISLCYCEQPTYPSRPVLPDSCGTLSECNYGKYREGVRVKVSLREPCADERCEPCCELCDDPCVVLARVTLRPNSPVAANDIECSMRRRMSLYAPAVVTGISWRHGAVYTSDEAKAVLGTPRGGARTDGLEIAFSKPVLAETLTPGVLDLWRIQGGRGLAGVISHIEGDYVDKPAVGPITSVRYRDESGETLNPGDRVLVLLRSSFVLDTCCRAVDGLHIGGKVPQLEDYAAELAGKLEPVVDSCLTPPGGCGPWTSGNGVPGGTFESWFFVE